MKLRALLLCSVVGAALIVPTTASAASKSVFMGTPPVASHTFQSNNGDVNDFFPHGITVHVGDSVRFVPVGFHTVDIPAKGAGPLALITPAGSKVAGVNDEAGQPFWFNGLDAVGFNPQLGPPGLFGAKTSYTGKKRVESGLPFAEAPKDMVVKFTKKGSFTYYCDVHPGMKGVVHVVAKKAKAPSKKADAKVVKREIATDIKTLKQIAKTKTSSGTIQIGASGAHGVESYGFYPAAPTVKVGTTVTFKMPVGSTEEHTATTGPGDPEQGSTYLGMLAGSLQGSPTLDPRAAYPSDAPGGTPAALTPTLHGNGFWNAGVLDQSKSSPLASSNKVTFAAAGTYTFYCLIHPFMKTTVTVTQ